MEKLTYCRVCEAGCGLVATVEHGRVTQLRPDRDHIVSRGHSCPKGIAFHQVTHDPDRLLHPLERTRTGWERIAWPQAIAEIAAKLTGIRLQCGADAVALYLGNPSAYSLSHRLFGTSWLQAIGSRNGYGAGSQDNLSCFLASKFLYGAFLRRPVPDLDRTNLLLVLGANPLVSEGTQIHAADIKHRLAGIRERGGRLVVIDPRRTETARVADEHHFIRPTTDAFLLLAMIREVLAGPHATPTLVAQHVVDLEWLRASVEPFTAELAAMQTGIDADTIRRLAHEVASTEGAAVYGRPVCGPFGTLAAWGLEALNIVAGNLDVPGGMVFSDGVVDLAAIAARLGLDHYGPHRSRVGNHPAVLGELPAGVLADEITTPGPGQIRALVVSAGNPVVSIANGAALATAMQQLECTVVLDIAMTETAVQADYVLPCTTFLEREDFPFAHANLLTEPYAQWTEAVIPAQGEAKPEWEIFTLLSDAMGLPILNSRAVSAGRAASRLLGKPFTPRVLVDLLIRTGPYGDGYVPWADGLTLEGVAAHPHGLRLRGVRTGILPEKLLTPDRKIHLRGPEIETELQRLLATVHAGNGAHPFRLIGRRDVRSMNSWLHNVPLLMRGDRCRRLRVHPDDAARLGLIDGGRAEVRSDVGAVTVEVRITDEVMPGVVCLPHGWSEGVVTGRHITDATPGPNCNDLIDARQMEPLAGMAYLNGYPVDVRAV